MKDERHNEIIKLVEKEGKLSVNYLSEILHVTKETIRRDLTELEKSKRISRIHGAAIPYENNSKELLYHRKLALNETDKKEIARRAAALVESNDMIVVDGGTTTVHMPEFFNGIKGLKVVTNSLTFALKFNEALENGRVEGELIMAPGVSYYEQQTVKGAMTLRFLSECFFDKAFISCGGLTDDIVTEYDFEETEISKIMMAQSRVCYLLCGRSKFGLTKAFKIANTQDFDQIIMNDRE
ncbi:DeoR/GlpR family DNA-binding transcription regulator [Macrococcus bovicus]|uniref:DeoR/GlpR family DNA-binding transcription regulator n=1 Tax=Macrococcus bovicus TaxID=69968 RepID=UPI0025A573C6|nr:DeoR/GlpR family DNA-binding transcription regulator [Macrococcus bovicus]WJP97379.1 DeoR/GlpR family DNA-binding transcription regulator [Macrococcus bovicus]